nr:hypothetical protein Itr_chr15CG13090 [Ipomoea trifida]
MVVGGVQTRSMRRGPPARGTVPGVMLSMLSISVPGVVDRNYGVCSLLGCLSGNFGGVRCLSLVCAVMSLIVCTGAHICVLYVWGWYSRFVESGIGVFVCLVGECCMRWSSSVHDTRALCAWVWRVHRSGNVHGIGALCAWVWRVVCTRSRESVQRG